jgi:ribonuclease HII
LIDPRRYERECEAQGFIKIAGLDEAGRGPLAGPVVAAAVRFPAGYLNSAVDDSKKLTAKKRDALFEIIKSDAIDFGIGAASVEEIDEVNILQATYLAMRRAVESMKAEFDILLIDGRPTPPMPCPRQLAIVKGDSLSISISAASILAKVTRDRSMSKMDLLYPEYGFSAHKGYGSAKHIAALKKYGPCPIHRKTFRPISEMVAKR